MKIKNADSIHAKALGLIGQKNIASGIAFKTRLGVHTFFMSEPIDVVLIDDNKIVQKIKKNLTPWKIWTWGLKLYTVVELPQGYIRGKNIKPGSLFASLAKTTPMPIGVDTARIQMQSSDTTDFSPWRTSFFERNGVDSTRLPNG